MHSPETFTTVGWIPHRRLEVDFGGERVGFWAPVRVKVGVNPGATPSPDVQGDQVAFALPGGGSLMVSSWL